MNATRDDDNAKRRLRLAIVDGAIGVMTVEETLTNEDLIMAMAVCSAELIKTASAQGGQRGEQKEIERRACASMAFLTQFFEQVEGQQ